MYGARSGLKFSKALFECLLNKVLLYWQNKYVQLFDWLQVSVDQLMFSIFRSCLKTNKDGS